MCIEQNYELFSSNLNFSVYIDVETANNTEGLKIYLEYGKIIEKIENNPTYRPKNLIHEQEIFLSN